MIRRSKISLGRRKGREAFCPDMARWKKVCSISAHDTQIIRSFHICPETFYGFLDKERYKEEQDGEYTSEYLESYINERLNTQYKISAAYLDKIEEGDSPSILFGMKTFNGHIEAKDRFSNEVKRQELILKTQEFLLKFSEKFSLNFDDVKSFAKNYFIEIEGIQG